MLIKIPSNTPIAVLQDMLAARGMTLRPQGDRYQLEFLRQEERRTANKKEGAHVRG